VSTDLPPTDALYVVEFERHQGDLGVSLILRASCDVEAKLKAWKFWPEYKRLASRTHISLIDYAEIDWESGRCLVVKRRKRAPLPVFASDEPTMRPKNAKREEGAQ
jgi:hypothetical protein